MFHFNMNQDTNDSSDYIKHFVKQIELCIFQFDNAC